MNEPLGLEIRRKIHALISKNPGLHVHKISEVLKISDQLADYHLLYLEHNGIITAIKEEGYKRYYVKGKMGAFDRRHLSMLRQEIPLKIILLLLKNNSLTHKEILSYLDVAPSTLSYHLQKLMKNDLICIDVSNNEKKYLVKDKKSIIQLLVKYKPFSWIKGFTDVWADFTWE